MTGTRRGLAAIAALVSVLAMSGSAPVGAATLSDAESLAQCMQGVQELRDEYRDQPNAYFSVSCQRPDGTVLDPALALPATPVHPAPVPVMSAGREGCVTGPGRPVADTTMTAVLATAVSGTELDYEFQRIGDGGTLIASRPLGALEFAPGDLEPGEAYRWRARVDVPDPAVFGPPEDERAWSPWCEFAVSADAIDYSNLGDVSFKAMTEMGLRPEREYTVRLTGDQQRLLRAGSDVGRTRDVLTLTGLRWTDLLVQLDGAAIDAEDAAAEAGEPAPPESAAYRALVNRISVRLGGPPHPQFN